MARATFVKKARRAVPSAGIKVGDSYWWWSFKTAYGSRKVFSKTQPKPSQLTQSTFYSTLLRIQEEMPEFGDVSEVESWAEDAASELQDLADECQSSFDNLPEGLQQGPTGELLQERIDGLQSIIDELQSLDYEVEDVDLDDLEQPIIGDQKEALATAQEAKVEEKLEELRNEIENLDWGIG